MPLRISQRHLLAIAVVILLVLGSIFAAGFILLFIVGTILVALLMVHWYILLIISADSRCHRIPRFIRIYPWP